ncbi:hypothetical protein D3C78_1774780 [compost metagenome]
MLEISLSKGLDRRLDVIKHDAESGVAKFINDTSVQPVLEIGTSCMLCNSKQRRQTLRVGSVHW